MTKTKDTVEKRAGVCKKCGPVEVDWFTDNGEEWMGYPVALAPTIQALGKAYVRHSGSTYERDTGNKMKDDWERKWFDTMSHLEIWSDEKESKEHTLEPIECWSLIL